MLRSTRTGAVLLMMTVGVTITAQPPAVDEIVARNLKAKGGVEKLKAIRSVKITGRITAQGTDMPMTTWAKRPNLLRREMQYRDSKIISGFDGTTVWTINPMTGFDKPQEITGPPADMAKEEASNFDGPLVDYKSKGYTVELVGIEEIDGRKANHLKITKTKGQVHHYYLGVTDDMEFRTVTTIEQGPVKGEVTTDLSNFQEVDGVILPFMMKQSMNGKPNLEVTIEKVEFNIPIDDAIFKMPEKE
jgi:outer membrane lipoprotein-sorting protein